MFGSESATAIEPIDPSGILPSPIGVQGTPPSVVRKRPPLATPMEKGFGCGATPLTGDRRRRWRLPCRRRLSRQGCRGGLRVRHRKRSGRQSDEREPKSAAHVCFSRRVRLQPDLFNCARSKRKSGPLWRARRVRLYHSPRFIFFSESDKSLPLSTAHP